MLRFGSAIACIAFLVLAIKAPTPGVLGFAILMIVVCATVSVFAFAAARIDGRSRNQVYVPSPEEAEMLKRLAQQRKQAPGREPPADSA